MPNWVFNQITIKGKTENIERFISDSNKNQNGKLSFSSWIPVPETFEKYDTTNYPNGEGLEVGKPFPFENDGPVVTAELIEEYKAATKLQAEQYGVVGWYDYNLETYGCKWDSKLVIESNDDEGLVLNCDTPWAAPTNFFITMSNRYPDLSFNMASDSPENGYYEEYLIEKGQVTVLKSEEYNWDEYIEDDNSDPDNPETISEKSEPESSESENFCVELPF